ncbi:hypothetical protein O3P69_001780 [Scylla paramamosain]|uniref:Uncharacterized protein n=1 Tax=Scylla paramamosain TaxID=85552 RepID=A0AAW0V0D7_SCYPA
MGPLSNEVIVLMMTGDHGSVPVLIYQASVVSYGKTVEDGPKSQQEQIDNAKFFQCMFDNILKSIPQASHSISSRAAKPRRMRRNKQVLRGGKVAAFDYKHEMNHVPVLCKKSSIKTAMDYPSVSKLPALNTDALQSVFKNIEDLTRRFPGVNADKYNQYFNFAHEAMFYLGPVFLESSFCRADFKKLARNIFINTNIKATLMFLSGVAKRVGMAECIAFYTDLMCAEYDFLGLGLKELTANYFAVDIKDNTRPVLAILDCLSPLGYDFKTAERQVKKTQRDAPAHNRARGDKGIETIRETVDLDDVKGLLSGHLSGCALKQYAFKETTKRPFDIPKNSKLCNPRKLRFVQELELLYPSSC